VHGDGLLLQNEAEETSPCFPIYENLLILGDCVSKVDKSLKTVDKFGKTVDILAKMVDTSGER
jgi:hypothetical protein